MSFDRDLLPDAVTFYYSQGMELYGSGKWQKTLCPFHDDHHPSLSINTKNGAFCCFSCQAKGGDIVSFLMQRDGLDFISAVKALGAWTGNEYSTSGYSRKPAPLSAYDALEILKSETLICVITTCNIAAGYEISTADKDRLIKAVNRIQSIQEMFP